MKRYSTFAPINESTPKTQRLVAGKQFSLQTIASSGAPITTFDGNLIIQSSGLKQQIKPGIKFKPGTAIKLEPHQLSSLIQSNGTISSNTITTASGNTLSSGPTGARRTILIKAPPPIKKTIKSVTIELIEKNPYLHLGVTGDRLSILQNIVCPTIGVSRIDLYIALKKLRLNEDFAVLGEYFEYNEQEVQRIFTKTILKLSKCLKFLIRWPESKKYYDRHKNLPIPFRSKLSFVQSLIECVETDIRTPLYPQTLEQLYCKNFKFILSITTSGVISYVSDAFSGGNHDDLTIFNACNFKNVIPKYLSLVADPGKAIRKKQVKNEATNAQKKSRKIIDDGTGMKTELTDSDSNTDSADEFDEVTSDGKKIIKKQYMQQMPPPNNSTMNIVNSELTSKKVKDFSIPTLRVREAACRLQIRNLIYLLREFKILQPHAILEPQIYQYMNEILVICSALINLQR
ncbi:uncharacterized protein LOC129606343 [Condylostylus longicornis]|uniref:uncharacterized protein LOC129606343 n=1 Tax=Condylostylus longicornis TaxID=2530218 RepID=UPI00244E3EAA|nr:uncharacterized protein LOC129606343 [Condylostylus longicornis]XP_055372597.1 uncharacterized protein LOC129606343 [Condylostylus longicornis]XP_055372598.1 uncharacterized protein LOC129606343 [Condylostylus longicornis]